MTRQTAYTSKRKADSENELSLVEFVNLIFEELGDKWKFKHARTIDYSFVMCSIYWKETIIPCVTELNEMAQTDSTLFEFFVVFLSQFDIGKDSSKDFGTLQIFYSLKSLKAWQSKIILSHIEGISEQDVSQLQHLLEDNNPEDFTKVLRRTKNFNSIVDCCSVLGRFNSLRVIYASIIKNPDTDSLGKLSLLFEEYIRYFSLLYNQSNRLCDGIIYDFLCILNQTRNRKYGDDFCEVAQYIGECCITGLILLYCMYKNQMPTDVRDLLSNIVLDDYCNDLNSLYSKYNKCNSNEEKTAFLKKVGGDLKTEFYSFLYKYLNHELAQTIPLMQELSTAVVEHPFINTFLSGTNQPVLSTSEEATVKEIHRKREPYILPGRILLYDDHFTGDPETIILNQEQKKAFLERLADALYNNNYISEEDKEVFVYAFSDYSMSGRIDETIMIDWKKTAAQLLGLCCVLFNDEIFREKKWHNIADFFLVKGKPLDTSNASRYRTHYHRYEMQKIVKSVLN